MTITKDPGRAASLPVPVVPPPSRRRALGLGRARDRRVLLAVGAALLLVAGGIVAAVRGTGAATSPAATAVHRITVSDAGCAPGWVAPRSGRTIFEVANLSTHMIFGVDLLGGNGSAVYGEIEMLAPGTKASLQAVLPPGQYSFDCEAFSGATSTSAVATVTGPPVAAAPSYVPPTSQQIQLATLAYRTSLAPILTDLGRKTDVLAGDVRRGDLAAARAAWLPAHLDYERLGAAYDTFGPFDAEINEKPLGLVGGVHSPDFHGFFRLEYGLWHGQGTASLVPVANALDRSVHALAHQFPRLLMPANDLSLRTHEILENTLQFELSGELDEGSHTTLATAWANAQGTSLSLGALAPLLRRLDPSLLRGAERGLAGLSAELHGYERPDGSWVPLEALSQTEREHLDAAMGGLVELLSAVPDRLQLPIRPSTAED